MPTSCISIISRIGGWLGQCLPAFMLCVAMTGAADAAFPRQDVRVEVFCFDDCTVNRPPAKIDNTLITVTDVQVYPLGEFQRVEAALSKNLGTQSGPAKHLALQRIQSMDASTRARLQQTALGLARVMQYKIDRVPAIVLDGQCVVYGTLDLHHAMAQYRAWQAGEAP